MASLFSAFAKHKKRTSLAVAVIAAFSATTAEAVLTDNITLGNAKALALGHAVTADPPGIDSVHYNPAGLTRLKGTKRELKLIAGSFNIELEFGKGYTDSWEKKLQDVRDAGGTDEFLYDESNGQTSETEGAALLLPFVGMEDIPVILAPLGGASYNPPGSNITFATNVYSPMMVGFNRSDTDPGRFMGERLSFSLITYFAPSVAVEFSDTLSFGAALTFNYAGIGIDLPFREPNFGLQWLDGLRRGSCGEGDVPDNFLEISDFIPCISDDETVNLYDTLGYLSFEVENNLTFGMNIGALWEATPWLTFGMTYQSPVKMDLEGEFTWTQGESLLNFFQELEGSIGENLPGFKFSSLGAVGSLVEPVTKGDAKIDMTMPDHFSTGFSLQLTPSLKVNADYKFTRWSEWSEIPLELSKPIGVMVIASAVQPDAAPAPAGQRVDFPLGLEDTWNFGIGFEYQWNDRLALRMGYEDRPSSIPKEARSPLLPIGDSELYALGANYKLSEDESMDFAIASMRSSVHMPGNTSRLGNSEDFTLFIYNPYSGNDITAKLDVLLLEMSYRSSF